MKVSGQGGRILIGVFLLLIGAVFLVDSYTDWDFPSGALWPIFPLALGLVLLFRRGSRLVGGVLVVVGGVPLFNVLGIWSLDMGDIWRLWPLILIVVGVRILFRRRRRNSAAHSSSSGPVTDTMSSEVDISAIFGGTEQRVAGSSFSGGRITAVFGGASLDMRDAVPAGGEATIDVTAIFGGVELQVPSDWAVNVRTTNILGGAQDNRSGQPTETETANRVVITGICVFGGLEIKS